MKLGASGLLTVAAAILVALGWSPPLSAAPLSLAAEPERIAVAEVTPGGRVAVTGLTRTISGTIPGFERRDLVLEDADGDGRVEITLERPSNPEWAQWIAVDLASGEWATAGRSEAAEPARPVAVGRELSAGSSLWPVPAGIVEVLVVRPGEGGSAGAWGGGAWDGGSTDGDGVADGSAGIAPARLRPVAGSGPAPESYEAGDVLIAITPRALRYGITRVVEEDREVAK